MDGEQVAAALATVSVELKHLASRVSNFGDLVEKLDGKIDQHVADEEARLKHIEERLSFAKTVLMLLKAAGLTVVFFLTLKFGDIRGLWK